ncbi:hypothetical protein Hanom_Chr02g00150391 [Helianthus anomalus]
MGYMDYKYAGFMAKRTCREYVEIFGCEKHKCYSTCVKRHGSESTGYCLNFLDCICHFPCGARKMDVKNYDISPLPSNPYFPNVSPPAKT